MNFNILGIGLPQIMIVLVLSLVLFGPKQMMQYAYQAGRFLAKARAMWEEAARNMQAEIQNSGIDLNEFKDLGKGLQQDVSGAVSDVHSTLNVPAWQPFASVEIGPNAPSLQPPGLGTNAPIATAPAPPAPETIAAPPPSLNMADATTEVAESEPTGMPAESSDATRKYDAWLLS